jgi:hypothetical protein
MPTPSHIVPELSVPARFESLWLNQLGPFEVGRASPFAWREQWYPALQGDQHQTTAAMDPDQRREISGRNH